MTAVEVVVVWCLCVINLLATKFLEETTTAEKLQAAAQKRERNNIVGDNATPGSVYFVQREYEMTAVEAATKRARGTAGSLPMGQDLPPGYSQKEPHVGTNPENLRRRDPKRLRDLLTPLLDLDEDVANLQNLDKVLADRFAQFSERRKQLQVMKNEDEREIVLKTLEQKEASHATDCSSHAEEHEEGDASYVLLKEELKHLKDE